MQQIVLIQLTTTEKLLLGIIMISIFLILTTIYLEYKGVREIENRIAADKEVISEQKKEYAILKP